MSDQREQSPDWLQSFQPPAATLFSLSSDSDSSPSNSPIRERSPEEAVARGVIDEDPVLVDSEEEEDLKKDKKPRTSKKGKQIKDEEKDENRDVQEEGVAKDDSKKPIHPSALTKLPLVFPDKVQRDKALVECDGDTIDLSGDVGAVGRVVISNSSSEEDEMLLDLKGTIYKSTIVPSRTFCIVSFGQTEAKIEAIMTDYIQLKPHSNVFEAETMVEGTLDGFSFDSEDEGDKSRKASVHQDDQVGENGDQPKVKAKGRKEKSSGPQKKAKVTGKAVKQTRRAVRKPQATKKGKGSKK